MFFSTVSALDAFGIENLTCADWLHSSRAEIPTSSPRCRSLTGVRSYNDLGGRESPQPSSSHACSALTASMPQAHSAGQLEDPTSTSSASVAHVPPSPTSSSTDPLILLLLSKISDQLADLQVHSATSAPSPRAYSDDTRAPRGRGHRVFHRSAPVSGQTRFPGDSAGSNPRS